MGASGLMPPDHWLESCSPKDENQGVVKRQPSAFSFVADRDRCVFAIDKPMKLSNSLLPFENTFA